MEEIEEKCIKVRVLQRAIRGEYIKYVVMNIDEDYRSDFNLLTLTRCPNWNGKEPDLMQEGFMTFRYVVAGVDKYYDKTEETHKVYNYTAIYFHDFIPVTHVLKDGYVVKSNTLKVS